MLAVWGEKSKLSQPSEAGAAVSVFWLDWPENTSLVEDFVLLFSVKFRQIPFSSFREEMSKH